MQKIRLMIADGHALTRLGLRRLVEKAADIEVVAEARDGEEALRSALSTRPDVLLLDVTMPLLSGLEVARRLQAEDVRTLILVLSDGPDPAHAAGFMESGAAGYIPKELAPEVLLESLRAVTRGEGRWFISLRRPKPGRDDLTEREKQVLNLMAEGLSNDRIADRLSISVHTVRNHVASIYAKLRVNSWREAVAWAWEGGLKELQYGKNGQKGEKGASGRMR